MALFSHPPDKVGSEVYGIASDVWPSVHVSFPKKILETHGEISFTLYAHIPQGGGGAAMCLLGFMNFDRSTLIVDHQP